jgi:hypothetical protein
MPNPNNTKSEDRINVVGNVNSIEYIAGTSHVISGCRLGEGVHHLLLNILSAMGKVIVLNGGICQTVSQKSLPLMVTGAGSTC